MSSPMVMELVSKAAMRDHVVAVVALDIATDIDVAAVEREQPDEIVAIAAETSP